MDHVSGHGNLWFIVLLSTTTEELRGLDAIVEAMRSRKFSPARSEGILDKIGKQPAVGAEPLPFLYQG
jgi:hypothetical protein